MPKPDSEIFLVEEKKNKSSAVPIRLLANKISACYIVENLKANLVLSFQRILMTSLSARSNIVIISQKKI